MEKYKPTKEDLQNAIHKTIHDVVKPNLQILFCGINPGLYTGATGHHFARPGNRFWPTLFAAGITPKLFKPSEQEELLNLGYGITNFVQRTTATAAELSKEEFREGQIILSEKVKKYKPKVLAILGVGAFQVGFNQPKAKIGLQEMTIGGTKIWILPNPSGLNANYQLKDLSVLFKELKEFASTTKIP
jgi:double-stranded uracil-DNA glycosylase